MPFTNQQSGQTFQPQTAGGSAQGFDPQENQARRQEQLKNLRESIQEQPLNPQLRNQFDTRRRQAERQFDEAQVQAQRAETEAQRDFDSFIRQLGQQTDEARQGIRQDAAARNLAFQPAFMGRGMRDVRDQAAETQAEAVGRREDFMRGIEEQLGEVERMRDEELAAIAREKARFQADHEQFIESALEALR